MGFSDVYGDAVFGDTSDEDRVLVAARHEPTQAQCRTSLDLTERYALHALDGHATRGRSQGGWIARRHVLQRRHVRLDERELHGAAGLLDEGIRAGRGVGGGRSGR